MRQFILPLALALARDGYDVHCACGRGPHWEELKASGLPIHELPIARSGNPIRAAFGLLRTVHLLRRLRPHVLHVHTPVASMIGRLAGTIAGVPVIVYTAHGFYFHEHMPPGKRLLHVILERFFGLFNDYLFCVSGEDARDAVALRIARQDRVFQVGNGVDQDRFHPKLREDEGLVVRRELGIPPECSVVAIMGRLVREKGYREFFTAAAALAGKHPLARFLVIGDTVSSEHDDAKAEIVAMAQHPELQGRVVFAGMRSDVPRVLAAADIFALPSYREGLPVSILEAMMMELPVVATHIRGCREEVVDGETGFLVPRADAEALEGALDWLLTHPSEAVSMGRRGRMIARERFEENAVLNQQVDLYRILIGRPHR